MINMERFPNFSEEKFYVLVLSRVEAIYSGIKKKLERKEDTVISVRTIFVFVLGEKHRQSIFAGRYGRDGVGHKERQKNGKKNLIRWMRLSVSNLDISSIILERNS